MASRPLLDPRWHLETLEDSLDEVLAAPRPAMLVLRIESNGRRPAAPGLRRSTEALAYLREYLARLTLD